MYKLAKVALRVIALSGFLHLSCGRDPGASIYQTPEITNVYADAEAHRVLFGAMCWAGNIRECRIYFGETEENLKKILSSFTDKNRFTVLGRAGTGGNIISKPSSTMAFLNIPLKSSDSRRLQATLINIPDHHLGTTFFLISTPTKTGC